RLFIDVPLVRTRFPAQGARELLEGHLKQRHAEEARAAGERADLSFRGETITQPDGIVREVVDYGVLLLVIVVELLHHLLAPRALDVLRLLHGNERPGPAVEAVEFFTDLMAVLGIDLLVRREP